MIWLILFSAHIHATSLNAISPNNRGVQALKDENEYRAYQNLVEAAAADSFDPTIRLNLGLAYARNEEIEKAIQEFQLADQLAEGNKDLQFMARFNLGHTLGTKGDIPGALKAYQAALEIQPESKEVKTNIELLWQGGGKGGKGGQNQKGGKGGEGEGSNSENQDQEQQEGQGEKEDQKKQPKPFDSKDLTPETVGKILEEMKNQEQRVRAEHYSKGKKEKPRGKDW
jgi:Ca-activated chloride channel homolog